MMVGSIIRTFTNQEPLFSSRLHSHHGYQAGRATRGSQG